MNDELFDVIAINIQTGAERFLAERKTRENAEAIVSMAVMRCGVIDEYFIEAPHPHTLRQVR